MRQYRGLTLTTPDGIAWRWFGSTVVHRHGRDLRVEKWQGECPQCGETVTIRAKLAGGLRRVFYDRRYNVAPSEVVEVRLSLPNERPLGAFNLRNCEDHPARLGSNA